MSNVFEEIKLSTLDSIADIEKEVNSLCGTKYVSGIIGNDTEDTVDFSLSSATKVKETYSDGSTAIITLTDNVYAPKADKEVISYTITETTDADFLNTVIPLTEGYGVNIKNTNEDICGVLKSATLWSNEIETDDTWNSKIAIAKRLITTQIRKDFILKGINEVHYNNEGKDILDFITNPEVFNLASDFLTLSYIYNDLSNGGTNEAYENKSKLYRELYNNELSAALVLCQINHDASKNSEPTDNLRATPILQW